MANYDVIIIGSGPGGYAAACEAARLGAKALIIEKEEIGGVCLNWGCIPTKAIIASVKLFENIKKADEFGLNATVDAPDIMKIMNRKNTIVSNLQDGATAQLKRLHVDVLKGTATLKKQHTVQVRTGSGEEMIEAGKIIIASGSSSLGISFIPFDGTTVIDSKTVLDLEKIPHSLVIIGGGAIGCEFASIFNALGTTVTIIEALDRLLPREDDELSKRLALTFKKKGITVIAGDTITSAHKGSDGISLQTEKNGILQAEKTLLEVGRKPNIDGLGLDQIGIVHDTSTIMVNKYLETNVSGVYAIGDVVSSPRLAHVATHEGIVAAQNSVGGSKRAMDYRAVPNCIFTIPEIATVGLTKQSAIEQNFEPAVAKYLYSALGKAHCSGKTEGFIKLLYDKKTKKLLGAHILGESASDIIAEIGLALQKGLTIDDLATMIHAHPTFGELVQEAVFEAQRQYEGK